MTPNDLGYRIPAEWMSHEATQMHWPSNTDTWPGERMKQVEEVYLEIIKKLHLHEPILLLCNREKIKYVEKKLHHRIANNNLVHLVEYPVNDIWSRDSGPIFVHRNNNGKDQFAITDWEYNAWGEKYRPSEDDNRLPAWFAEKFDIQRFEPGMVLEGGAIDTNGQGILLTTESVLLNPNRNPDLSRSQIEKKLKDYLGVEKIIWLKNGLAGDDTDGHVDDLSRFLNANTILTTVADDPDDLNYDTLQINLEILRHSRNLEGNPFQIELLPLPETRIEGTTVDGSEVVPASYINFYVANGVVLVPLYDERYDKEALELFEKFFPTRKIEGIHCKDLVWGQGSLHCITQPLYGLGI